MKGFHPVGRRKMSLKKKGANGIVNGTKHSFGFAVLLRSIWTRKTHMDTVSGTEVVKLLIVKFFTVLTLKHLNFGMKLSLNK